MDVARKSAAKMRAKNVQKEKTTLEMRLIKSILGAGATGCFEKPQKGPFCKEKHSKGKPVRKDAFSAFHRTGFVYVFLCVFVPLCRL